MLLNKVENTLHRLYEWYQDMVTPLSTPFNEATQTSSPTSSLHACGSRPISSIFKAGLLREAQIEKNDLVDCLNDRCEHLTDEPFDMLLWWKLNAHKYNIVSQIAKDVLAFQISTVASESTFSTSDKILDSFRSPLDPKMVEALICTKNWMHSNKEPIVLRQYLEEVQAFNDSERAVKDESCVTMGVLHQ